MSSTIKYRPGRFAELHRQYPQVWRWLCDPGMAERMKALSRRGLPAVTALDIDAEPVWSALEVARDHGEEDQVKQMVGHQIRQIMEFHGYRKYGSKRIWTSWIFASGSVYRHPEWRRLYVHRPRYPDNVERYCVAAKRKLSTLPNPPSNCSEWVPYRMCRTRSELNFVLQGNLDDDFGLEWRNLRREVADRGYVVLERL